jgi:HlyD family secretion protein
MCPRKTDKIMNYETSASQFDSGIAYVDAEERAIQRKRWLIAGAVLLVLLVLAAAYFAMRSGETATAKAGAADDKQAARVTVIVPGKQLVENVISATGTLAARREMPVGVVGEGGLVQRVLVEAGTWVQQGQVLAIIERSVQAQEGNQLAAQVNVTMADARLAQSDLDRASALLKNGFVSKADIDRKTAARDSARARVAVAQAQLAASRARTGRLDIRAPAGGLVLTRSVEPGQVVGAGSGTLFRLARGGEMEMKAKLSESDLALVSEGRAAKVKPVGSDRFFAGQIWQISPVIDPQSRQGEARIALSYDPALRPGGFASAAIIAGTADVPLLPETAVQSDSRGNYVYVVNSQNKVERRAIVVDAVTDNGVSIRAGLTGTEQVVLSAGGFLNPGETVVPERAKPAR